MTDISRILTLVFTDLADSTALKTQRGDQAVGELITRHRAHVRRLAAESGGRIIDWAGDGCFLTFETPSAAVLFALRLQQVHREEPDLPGVRTGIHMGEVSERPGPDGDLAQPRVEGLAVDLAARISGLARPGQVLMSSAVADSARQRLEADAFLQPVLWRAHGSYALKGFDEALQIREAGLEGMASFEAPAASNKAKPTRPPESAVTRRRTLPIAIVSVVVLGAVGAYLTWSRTADRSSSVSPTVRTPLTRDQDRKSVAVLPFVNMSSDKENEYFSDGITEDLITALSKVSGLHVAARTSSFAFKGKNEPIESIGAQLHVGTVLEGSVAKAGNQVRITAQLINAADGYHLWSDSYDRELRDIFAIRSQVAETVAKALQVTLAAGERQTLEQKPTEDLEAYQLYLKARHATETLNDWDTAMRYLQQAIARDPNYALAYVGLAGYYVWIVDWALPSNRALPRAREAAEKALQLDPSLAEAHVWLALVRFWYDQDIEGSRHEFQTALTLQPQLASAHQWYSSLLVAAGQFDEGFAEGRRAVELDPLSPNACIFYGYDLYFAGRNDAAIEQFRTAVAIDPDNWWAHEWLGHSHGRAGRFPEAIAELLKAKQLSSSPEIESVLGRVYADAGNRAEATKVLNHLRQRVHDEFVSPAFVASILVGLGQLDEALVALAQAQEQRSYYVMQLKVDPDFDPLRSDPRFTELLKKVGLEP
ncbi:MAG: tetratricopeptide repeat protein [Deltaproteobacteria bacterium]|nr:tetratricopeptide repeat protein [Deltaproteobacteria bacterium]